MIVISFTKAGAGGGGNGDGDGSKFRDGGAKARVGRSRVAGRVAALNEVDADEYDEYKL